MIDIEQFTPITSLVGGMLIGLAATLMILLNGRIAGVSGIIRLSLSKASFAWWRLCFILGLLLGPVLFQMIYSKPTIYIQASPALILVAGFLVGFGTSMGAGCTSGHGICGLARLSLRSLVAVLVFMLSAMLTVYIAKMLAH